LASKKVARLSNHYLQIIGKPDSALIIIDNILKDSIRIKNEFNLGQLYLKRGVLYKTNNVEIVIKDNGKGFDITKEKLTATKIGLKTLSERSNFLKASFKILSKINEGNTLIFDIPQYEQT